ncbi:MAG: helix-turn-helix domain-containing protein [Clostridia bacterium]|nr:helix-turn-helix domain-containing protein [Clostridia bacterium]
MLKEGEMSLEQLYKMLHVSKRKAAWMLNNGIIPCWIRPTKTHRYIILREDVDAYLQKKRADRRKEIPVGIFNAKPTRRKVEINHQPMDSATIAECYITLSDDCRDEYKAHVDKRLKYFSDALSVEQAAEITGYGKGMILYHIEKKDIRAVFISGKYIISKAAIADFLVSDTAFEIVNKSEWHMNTILKFTKKKE